MLCIKHIWKQRNLFDLIVKDEVTSPLLPNFDEFILYDMSLVMP